MLLVVHVCVTVHRWSLLKHPLISQEWRRWETSHCLPTRRSLIERSRFHRTMTTTDRVHPRVRYNQEEENVRERTHRKITVVLHRNVTCHSRRDNRRRTPETDHSKTHWVTDPDPGKRDDRYGMSSETSESVGTLGTNYLWDLTSSGRLDHRTLPFLEELVTSH